MVVGRTSRARRVWDASNTRAFIGARGSVGDEMTKRLICSISLHRPTVPSVDEQVARMERGEIRERSCRVDADPDFTSFDPGYACLNWYIIVMAGLVPAIHVLWLAAP